ARWHEDHRAGLNLRGARTGDQRGRPRLHDVDLVLAVRLLVVQPARRDRVRAHAEIRAGQVLGPVIGLAAGGLGVPAGPLDDLHALIPSCYSPTVPSMASRSRSACPA